jgi:hypothetical protein
MRTSICGKNNIEWWLCLLCYACNGDEQRIGEKEKGKHPDDLPAVCLFDKDLLPQSLSPPKRWKNPFPPITPDSLMKEQKKRSTLFCSS